jgi:secreted protein with Ig-like and vWFA domain
MNNDETNPEKQTPAETELEARIVAWVSGEASAFEIAELERLVREKPELAIFKRRIEAVRGLVAEAVSPEKEPLALSAERRASLLRAIGAPEKAAPAESGAPAAPSLAVAIQRHRTQRRWMLAIAACLVCGLFFSALIPRFQRTKSFHASKAASVHDEAALQIRSVAEDKGSVEKYREERIAAQELRKGSVAAEMPAMPQGVASAYLAPASPRATPTLNDAAQRAPRNVRDGASEIEDMSPISVVTDQSLKDAIVIDRKKALGSANSGEPIAAEANKAASDIGTLDTNANEANANAPNSGANVVLSKEQVAGQQQAAANAAPAGAYDEPAALSAFTVEAAKTGGGKLGNSTLAGTGAKADLNDVSNSDSVVTDQFLQDKSGGDLKRVAGGGAPAGAGAEAEASASTEPVSTFSLHVSDVSFRLAQAALARGDAPDPSRIRPEEFYNAFDYGDPAPAMNEKVSCRIEQAADPVRQQRNLVRIAMSVPATGRAVSQPLRLTILLDTSGSMEREDRAAAVHRAMEVLVSLVGPSDRLTLVGFARQPRLLAEQLPGDRAAQLLDIIARTPAEGGTNIEEALRLGGELARRQFAPEAQNRIVLLTDGAANLGNADSAQLAASITTLRQQGISFDACGVGIDGINDEILEALTRKGAGRYYVVDTPESADAGFASQLAGALRPAAENVKVQVRFNPARVGKYRLVGFEHHRLNEADFRNDKVEAAALAAGEAAVALYEVEALPQGDGELGEVFVRFRDAASGTMVERSWTLPYDPYAPAFDRATPTMQLAGTAALIAEKLRGGATGDAIRLSQLAPVVNALRGRYAHEARVQELVAMFEQMRRLEKE